MNIKEVVFLLLDIYWNDLKINVGKYFYIVMFFINFSIFLNMVDINNLIYINNIIYFSFKIGKWIWNFGMLCWDK